MPQASKPQKTQSKGSARTSAKSKPTSGKSAQPKTSSLDSSPAALANAFQVFEPYRGTATCDDPRKIIVPIGSVYRDPSNANQHPDRNMRGIRSSLRRRGQTKPMVVDRDGMIIAGNGAHEGAELEGWKYVWIVTTHLTGAELLAYGIADNQLTRTSEWNWEALASHVTDLKAFDETEFSFSNDDLGFEEHELTPMLAADWSPAAISDEPSAPAPAAGEPDTANSITEDSNTHQVSTPPPDEADRVRNDLAIALTPNMRLVVDPAIARVRYVCSDQSISEGKCLELICADYIAGKQ